MNHPDFDRFVAENIDGLVRTAYLIVWDLPEAEDLVQETLFKVAKTLVEGRTHGPPGRVCAPDSRQARA